MKVTLTSTKDQSGIQLNGGEIIQNKQLDNSKREASKPQTDRRTSFDTTCPSMHKRVQDMVGKVTLNQQAKENDTPKKDQTTIKTQIHPEIQPK